MRNIYVLLIGMDQDHVSVSALKGCCNDIEASSTYLPGQIGNQIYQLKSYVMKK